jgi:pilus assembly protein CpaC
MPVHDRRWCLLLAAAILAGGGPRASAQQGAPAAGPRMDGTTTVFNGPAAGSPIIHNVRGGERLEMMVNTSRILTLDKKIPQVQVNNPDMVVPTPLSPYQVQIAAKKVGITQVNLWDENKQVYAIDVLVVGDSREFSGLVRTIYPGAAVQVVPVAGGAVLTGTVDQPEQISKIMDLAQQYYPKVFPTLTVVNVHQVLLHVKVMEVSRTKLRSLGIDWALFTSSATVMQTATGVLQGFSQGTSSLTPVVSGAQNLSLQVLSGNSTFYSFIECLRQDDLVKITADPTLVAYSGRPAQFVVGGEIAYPVSQGLGSVTIQWKNYGTQLDFVPIVLGGGRIRLEVRPEVSEVDQTESWTNLAPSIKTRRVETGVEMRAGQTLAIAGLLQSRTEAQKKGLPVLSDIPYIGAAFRRVSERVNEVETLILVTPELVEPMDCQEVPPGGPGLNTTSPSDCQLYCKAEIEVPKSGGCAAGSMNPGRVLIDTPVGGFPQPGLVPPQSVPTPAPPPPPEIITPGPGSPLRPGTSGSRSSSNPQNRPLTNSAGGSGGLPGFGGPLGYDETR